MKYSDSICLTLNGHSVEIEIEHIDWIVSPHSGRQLIEIQGILHSSNMKFHDWFLDLVANQPDEGIPSLETPTQPARSWRIEVPQWIESGSRYTYTVKLTEVELLKVEALIVDDLEMRPYKYREEFKDGLRIDVKVALTGADSERFQQLWVRGGYFPVIRRGIQEEARQMRFGAVYWSSDNDTYKYDFVLVERTPEDEAPHFPWDLAGQNARAQLAFEVTFRRNLLKLLQDKGLLTKEEVERLEQEAEKDACWVVTQFYRVRDVDLLP